MNPLTWETLVIIGTVAAVSFGGAMWLSAQFRRLEKIFYRELGRHRLSMDTQVEDVQRRLYRVELKVFGFTQSGLATPGSSLTRSEDQDSSP